MASEVGVGTDPNEIIPRIKRALENIEAAKPNYSRWKDNYEGNTALPCSIPDATAEYQNIQKIARLPMIGLATDVMVQRVRIGGFEPGGDKDDEYKRQLWREVWQANKMDARQKGFIHAALASDKGIVMVSRNEKTNRPLVTVEDPADMYVHPRTDDPRLAQWAVKRLVFKEGDKEVIWVWYIDDQAEYGFVKDGDNFVPMEGYEKPVVHGASTCPVIVFTWDGSPIPRANCRIDRLIGPQNVIDTLRFNLLINAQTTAFRQKVFEGFDPILRDENGNPVLALDSDGNPVLDANGNVTYQTIPTPKIGPHKAIYTPPDVSVSTLDPTDLANYGDPLDAAISHFASVAQVPSSYFQGNMSRVSGAALGAGNATQESFLAAFRAQLADSAEMIFTLACEVMGWDLPSDDSEVVWEDTAPVSLADLGDFASKAVPVGAASREYIMERLPGSSPQKIQMWIEQSDSAMASAVSGSTASLFGNRPLVNDNMGGAPNPVGNNINNE